jgi:hypothetical protein
MYLQSAILSKGFSCRKTKNYPQNTVKISPRKDTKFRASTAAIVNSALLGVMLAPARLSLACTELIEMPKSGGTKFFGLRSMIKRV